MIIVVIKLHTQKVIIRRHTAAQPNLPMREDSACMVLRTTAQACESFWLCTKLCGLPASFTSLALASVKQHPQLDLPSAQVSGVPWNSGPFWRSYGSIWWLTRWQPDMCLGGCACDCAAPLSACEEQVPWEGPQAGRAPDTGVWKGTVSPVFSSHNLDPLSNLDLYCSLIFI